MGSGPSKQELQDDLDKHKRQLAQTQQQLREVQARGDELAATVSARDEKLRQREAELANAARDCVGQLDAKQVELNRTNKARELAEELRRSDALLVKRVTTAMLRRAQGSADAADADASSAVDGGSLAAQIAVAANDELALRRVVQEAAARSEACEARVRALRSAEQGHFRRELCSALWGPQQADATVALRSSQLMVQGGLRMPRAPDGPLNPGSGLTGHVAVLRHFGDTSHTGKWAAVGGSMLWDVRERELSSLRFGVCAQPTPSGQLRATLDHTGHVTATVRSTPTSALTLALTGTVDLNSREPRGRAFTRGVGSTRVGVEATYDID